MKEKIEDGLYDTRMELSEFRYSAGVLGLIRYFKFHNINYYEGIDYIEYHSIDITEERYLLFVEDYFKDFMHHKVIEDILMEGEITLEQEKLLDEKLKANVIMKKVFNNIKMEKGNIKHILEEINNHRMELIKETFRNGKSLYANYCNTNSLLKEEGDCCRLLGYSFDTGKKSKSVAYNWNYKTFSYKDALEFDFIVFAFSKGRDAMFINNNISIKQLIEANKLLERHENARSILFEKIKDVAEFMNYDVEIITKNRENEYFETIYLRKTAIKILKGMRNYSMIKINYKVTEKYYINFEHETIHCILNNLRLDYLIETLLKPNREDKRNYNRNISSLIEINMKLYGGEIMDTKMKQAYACAKEVRKKIKANKVDSYREKLISAILLKDYDKACEILLQFSAYSGVAFNFAYDLYENFEENKNLVYTFITALNSNDMGESKNE